MLLNDRIGTTKQQRGPDAGEQRLTLVCSPSLHGIPLPQLAPQGAVLSTCLSLHLNVAEHLLYLAQVRSDLRVSPCRQCLGPHATEMVFCSKPQTSPRAYLSHLRLSRALACTMVPAASHSPSASGQPMLACCLLNAPTVA